MTNSSRVTDRRSLVDIFLVVYACGQDANMNYAYGDELTIVPYVNMKLLLLHPHMIVLLSF